MADAPVLSPDDVEIAPSLSADDVEIAAPQVRPEVQRAIASVPRPQLDTMQTERPLTGWLRGQAEPTPVSPEAVEEQKNLEEFRRTRPTSPLHARDVAGAMFQALTTPSGGGVTSERELGTPVRQGIQEMETPGQRAKGVLRVAGAGLEGSTPLVGPAALEAPISTALGFGEGYVAGKGARKIAKMSGASPETQELAESVGQMTPIIAHAALRPEIGVTTAPEGTAVSGSVRGAGAGVATTPEATIIRGKVGPFEKEIRIPRGKQPAGPALEPQTIEGELAANPPTRDEIADAQAATNYAGPEEAKAAVVQKRQAQRAAQTSAGTASPGGPEGGKAAGVVETTPKPAATPAVSGEVLPPGTEIPKSRLEQIKDELRGQYPGNSEDKLAAAAKKQLEFEQGRERLQRQADAARSQKTEPPQLTAADVEIQQPERRQDVAERKRVEHMTPEEMRQELLTSKQTGLPNRRAFDEAEKPGAVAMSDADGLKAFNDKFGYEAGNALLQAKADALREAGVDAYHDKGDEFLHRGASADELKTKLEKARQILRDSEFVVTKNDGSKVRVKGVDFSYGTGKDLAEAESGLKSHKSEREARGERARGELRGITQTPEGVDQKGGAGEVELPRSEVEVQLPPEEQYKHRSTQFNIPEESEAHSALETARQRISKGDLAAQGTDVGGNHVTVRYGLTAPDDADLGKLKKYLSSLAPFEATLGKTEAFPPSKSSDGAAVIHAPIDAPQLHTINKEMEKHAPFNEPTFSEYKPHATIAYVKPEKAARYTGMSVTHGKKFKVDHIAITDRSGNQTVVKMEGESTVIAPLKSGKDAPHYLRTLPSRAALSRFLSQIKEVGYIGGERGVREATVYWDQLKQQLVRLGPEATYRPETPVHQVVPSEYRDRFHWLKNQSAVAVRSKLEIQPAATTTPPEKVDLLAAEKRLREQPAAAPKAESEKAPIYSTEYSGPEISVEDLEKIRDNPKLPQNVRDDAGYVHQKIADSGWSVKDAMDLDGTDRLAKQLGGKMTKTINAQAPAVPPGSNQPVTGLTKVSTAEEQFQKDVQKRAAALRKEIATLEQQTSAPVAYYQDSAKNAQARDERSRNVERLSKATNELEEIERANPHEVKPVDPDSLPDAKKNKYGFQREYFTQALQPVFDAWKAHLGPKFANAVKSGLKGVGTPPDFPERQVLVDIPGDGHFRVNNDPKVLDRVIRGASKGFANPNVGRGLKSSRQRLNAEPSEPAKWSYLERMADEAVDAPTQEEKDAALETIENILGATPLKTLPKPGTTVRYRDEDYLVNGWDREHQKTVNLVPLDSEVGKQTQKWLEAGSPTMTKAESAVMSDRVRDVQESAPLYLLKHVADPPEASSRSRKSEAGFATPGLFVEPVVKVAEAVKAEYDREIKPGLDKLGLTFRGALDELTHLIAPRYGVPTRTIDSMSKMAGERERHRWTLEQNLAKAESLMERLPREEQIAFVDNRKLGKQQASPVLQDIADFIAKTDEETYRQIVETQVKNLSPNAQQLWTLMSDGDKTAFLHKIAAFKTDDTLDKGPLKELADGLLTYKANHQRVIWKVIPGRPEESGTYGVRGRRPLQGSKGFLKQSTLDTMSEGIESGGEPISYNPVTMFKLAQADAWRYITAQRMWQDAKAVGELKFVPGGERLPEGYRLVEDRIGDVRFPAASGEGMVQAGRWAMAEPRYRLLENMLSHDYIRESKLGNGLMTVKNHLTAYRLSLSPFHAFTTTVSTVAGGLGRGLGELNAGVRRADIAQFARGAWHTLSPMLSPVLDYRLGSDVVHFAADKEAFLKTQRGKDFIRSYPEADQLIDDLFSGGAKLTLHEDERLDAVRGLQHAIAEHKWLTALYKSPFALNQELMKPLFGYYIPRLKLASWLRDYSQDLADRADDIAAGRVTRGELARKHWDAIDNVFGQMNWDARWWNRTFKASVQLAFRAFTWFAGNIRLVKDAGIGQTRELLESARWWNERLGGDSEPLPSSGPVPRLDPNFGRILGLFAVVAAVNAAIQYAMTKESPRDVKDLLAARIGGTDQNGNPRRITVPAIVVRDALALYYHGAGSYLKAKQADWLAGIEDVLNNEDFRHAMIHNPEDPFWKQRYDDATHVLGNPIGIENYKRESKMGGRVPALLGEAGFSPAPTQMDQSAAWREATRLQTLRLASVGARNAESVEKSDQHRDILAALRNGNSDPLYDAVDNGTLSHEEALELLKRSERTPLQEKVANFSYSDIMRVYEKATAQEKDELEPLIDEKRERLLKRGREDEVEAAEAVQ